MAKARREDYHFWAHRDVFPSKLKKLSFGDIFGLFLGFLYDWSGKTRQKDGDALPRTADTLPKAIVEDSEIIVFEGDAERAVSVLKAWIFETQAVYTGDTKADAEDGFLSLKPVHIDMARIWPSQYSSDSRVNLQRLFFSLLAYNENGDVDLEVLEKVRDFFSERDSAKIGAFSRIIIDISKLLSIGEEELNQIRIENATSMQQQVPQPLCLQHAKMFRDDISCLMEYEGSVSHVQLMEWLYSCICFHLGTYTLRTALALRCMMEDAFESLEGITDETAPKRDIPGCHQCPGIDGCPFKYSIIASASDDFRRKDLVNEPFVTAVSLHKGLILEHPVYLSTLSRIRDAAKESSSLNERTLPAHFVHEYATNRRFRKKANKLLLAQVIDYIDHVSEVITPALADEFKKTVSKNPATCLRIFKDAVRLYYAEVGSRYDSTTAVWSFYRAAAGRSGANYLVPKTKERPEFYFLSIDFLTIMVHILLASNPTARMSEFLRFLKKRGVVMDSSETGKELAILINNLQEMGMYVKLSDDISAQFIYPVYPIRRDES
jgi:hypothetical protein